MTSRGDDTFVRQVVAQLPQLRRYAIALAGSMAVADDLVQDTLERAIRHATQLRDIRNLAGWLRRILHNCYIEEIRRGKGKVAQQDIEELKDTIAFSVPASDAMGVRDFVRAMSQLSPEHRRILLLAGVEEMNYRQIAEELDIPIGTVMSRLARARERLRAILEEQEGGRERAAQKA
jgi:RNA polymerase sigma-70 factor (ECF subfamily)